MLSPRYSEHGAASAAAAASLSAAASSAAAAASAAAPQQQHTAPGLATAAGGHTLHATSLHSSQLSHFQVGRKMNFAGAITSLDFSSRGDSLVLASDEPDEALHLFSVASAAEKKAVFCKRSGCDLVRFTHSPLSVLVASKNKGWDDSVRYLSLHDNKYLRYFKGHRDRVTSLSMSPADDSFLSAAMDHTVRLWDLRTNVCQGLMDLPQPHGKHAHQPPGKVMTAHDPSGMVFAIACSPNIVKLFDSRSYEQGPFATFEIPLAAASSSSSSSSSFSWSSLKFSPDGKDLLLTTTESHQWPGATEATHAQNFSNQILLIDSFDGTQKRRYVGHEYNPNEPHPIAGCSAVGASASPSAGSVAAPPAAALAWGSLPFEASFSPCGSFVFAGARSGSIHCWNAASGSPIAIWNGMHTSVPITAIQFCPTKMALVSADASGQMLWWIPAPAASHDASAVALP